ncbi:MAG TPA: S16 family serine protease [Verrucomicrobiales bacterium]|nr:S16 family serine protease [Verrucomicrobiales bacterium]
MDSQRPAGGHIAEVKVTAVESENSAAPLTLKLNEKQSAALVPEAVHEVEKHLSVKYNGLPAGWNVDIAISAAPCLPKDRPSTTLACALAIDSLLTGSGLDKTIAVTGDLNADGSIRPVRGMYPKIKAARIKDCSLVIIPRKNAEVLAEYAVAYGPEALAAAHLFDVATFAEARALALTPRPEPLQRAIAAFKEIQTALFRQPDPGTWIRHPKVAERLKAITIDAPGSFSARTLLAMAEGREPKTLSLRSSFEIVCSMAPFGPRIDHVTDWLRPGETPVPRKISNGAHEILPRIRDRLDPRVRDYASATINYLAARASPEAYKRLSAEFKSFKSKPGIADLLVPE